MVEITVMVEGGTIDPNVDAATVENTESLRQSFHRIFSELLGNEVDVKIKPLGGYKYAANKFYNSSDDSIYLYVDLDDTKDNIFQWFAKLKTENPQKPINFSDKQKEKVFFMIQEMEAWMLKQPESIELWGTKSGYQKKISKGISQHHKITGKDIESIKKPSDVLKEILRQYFTDTKRNKKVKYGKLKTAPSMLDCIDAAALKNNDSELERFYNYIKNRTQS